ncbi:MAG: HesA/MoeB/ThiF family protein [Planctomycetales bacterium]|nr:HesA/MoeB/ThiF family protein [Planctomycetales bacterium]
MQPQQLTEEERAIYEWQTWVPKFGVEGQEKLKGASVLVSRVGGLGSVVAYELAAAGVGRLVLAHAGNVKHSDLNRQLLMTYDWLGKPRVESAKRRLHDLNPRLQIETVAENLSDKNADRLIKDVDVVVDCAPLFTERFAMNSAAIKYNKPLVECAMYDLEAHIFTVLPQKTACVNCLYPQQPPAWKREFPVFGAVSGMVACLGAMEAIKAIAGFGELLAGRMVVADLRNMQFRTVKIRRNPECSVCGNVDGEAKS